MHFNEFKIQVEAQGVKLPAGWADKETYIEFAGHGRPGIGNWRNFTDYDVQMAVAWGTVHALTGQNHNSKSIGPELGRRAALMLAFHTTGWIVMSEGQVYWTDAPTERVFDKGAICIPALS